MANVKISELTDAGAIDGSELVELVQAGGSVKSTVSNIRGTSLATGSSYPITASWATTSNTSSFLIGARPILTAATTLYVNTTGSDSNNGFTLSTPLKTVQRAVDVAASLDTSIYDVTVQISDGTYEENVTVKKLTGAGLLYIKGNASNSGSVTIKAVPVQNTIDCYGYGLQADLSYLRLEGTSSGYALLNVRAGGTVYFSNVIFGTPGTGQPHIACNRTGYVVCLGPYQIIAGGAWHLFAWANGVYDCRGRTVTISNKPNFTSTFAQVEEASVARFDGSTFSGVATGSRFLVYTNAVIQTAGGGATFLPGTVAGTSGSGGQYV